MDHSRMSHSRLPQADEQQSEVRQRYKILQETREFNSNLAAETAAQTFRVPVVLTALNERYRTWFSSAFGMPASEYRSLSEFCAQAGLSEDPFVVGDVRKDPFFQSMTVVQKAPHVVMFAGCPMLAPDGSRFGSLCLIDYEPRDPESIDLRALSLFSALISQDICVRSAGRYAVADLLKSETDKCALFERAMTDPLTTALNRRAFFDFSRREARRASRKQDDLSILVIDIDHFKTVNDTHGHATGDEVLCHLVACIQNNIRDEDIFGRIGGEEFALVLTDATTDRAREVAERLCELVKDLQFESKVGKFRISLSIGVSKIDGEAAGLDEALAAGDRALYKAKRGGRDRVVVG